MMGWNVSLTEYPNKSFVSGSILVMLYYELFKSSKTVMAKFNIWATKSSVNSLLRAKTYICQKRQKSRRIIYWFEKFYHMRRFGPSNTILQIPISYRTKKPINVLPNLWIWNRHLFTARRYLICPKGGKKV